jgi:hypothetical protein
VPGAIRPHLDQRAEGDARLGALLGRLDRKLGAERLDRRDALRRGVDIGVLALDADEVAAERLATAPVVPVPKNGSSTTSPGLVGQSRRGQQRFRLLRRMQLVALASFRRSPPVQIGNSQSERICTSSLAAFIAS